MQVQDVKLASTAPPENTVQDAAFKEVVEPRADATNPSSGVGWPTPDPLPTRFRTPEFASYTPGVVPQADIVSLPDINRRVSVVPVDIKMDLGATPQEREATLLRIQYETVQGETKVNWDAPDRRKVMEAFNQAFNEDIEALHAAGDLPQAQARSLKDVSVVLGYFGSPRHVAFCELASARTGGTIPPSFFAETDPLGGLPGNLPHDYRSRLPSPLQNILGGHIHTSPDGAVTMTDEQKEKLRDLFGDVTDREMLLGNTAIAHDIDLRIGFAFGSGPLAPIKGFGPIAANIGVMPGFPPQDGELAKAFEEQDLPVPDYVFSNGNTAGWRFDYLEGLHNGRGDVLLAGLGLIASGLEAIGIKEFNN